MDKMINKNTFRELLKCKKLVYLKQNNLGYTTAFSGFDNSQNLNKIRELASSFFQDFVDVKSQTQNTKEAFVLTKTLLQNHNETIKNPTFVFDNLVSSCSYATKEDGMLNLYEIKCSTKVKQPVIVDYCFLKKILDNLGISVSSYNVIIVNSNYEKENEISSQKLLKIVDVTERVLDTFENTNFELLKEKIDDSCANIGISNCCNAPYPCEYFEYCKGELSSPNVFDLYDVGFEEKISLYNDNKIDFESLKDVQLNKIQQLQVECYLNNKEHIEKDKISEFLSQIKKPIYFLDFETTQNIIPHFVGTKPFEEIPFMFSLHKLTKSGKLKHSVVIGKGNDCRKKIAKKLCSLIRKNSSIIVYGDSLEKRVIHELSNKYKLLSKKLKHISSNIVDLSIPFLSGHYYTKDMASSLSLKSILPALFPNSQELDYHKLDLVQNGNDAMLLYPKIATMAKQEKKQAINRLKEYCSLDTYAMVRIYEKLLELTKN